ncbi:MAG TPA: PepSY-associated TM helix domain-containing protein [Pseudonocardiaceae bacterium]|nr:PepSY-associated TM helix domain-containing protein [Pseudonocardiaceae bacterium]
MHRKPARSRRDRPIRAIMVAIHRWTALALGLALVIETTCGAAALYQPEWFRATHSWFYQHTPSEHPISLHTALDVVAAAHPAFHPAWVSEDGGVYAVGDAGQTLAYSVDPGSGRINGVAALHDGVMGFIVNLHECALTCAGYPGYLAALARPAPGVGISWGHAVLAVLGLFLVLLAISGAITWWPSIRRLAHGFRVRWRRSRFARDYDLHKLIGIVAVLFLLMWGITSSSTELPAVHNAWLTMTGGTAVDPNRYVFVARPAPAGATEINADQAAGIAARQVPAQVVWVSLPQGDAGSAYYTVWLDRSYAPYRYEAFFGGDSTVFVDARQPGHVSVVDDSGQPAANAFYDQVLRPAHFGWMVNGWWRIGWFAFGMTPLLLMITGLSTWLIRRGARRRRERARASVN